MSQEMRLAAIHKILMRVLSNNALEKSVRHDLAVALDFATK